MNVTPLRVLLFVVAAIVAAGGTAYFTGALDTPVENTSKEIASLPDGEATSKDDRVRSKASTDTGEEASEPSPDDDREAVSTTTDDNATDGKSAAADDAADTADEVVVPGFDVVRVEPDGSLVIAGNAAPNAHVEVVDGATVLGEAKAGPAGDFAVVLDNPLDPGDYQIVLRATSPGGVVATSRETAVVSVPDRADGQVLALVEQPGEPSRLITVPKGEGEKTEVAAATVEGDEPRENSDMDEADSSLGEEIRISERAESGDDRQDVDEQASMSASDGIDGRAVSTGGEATVSADGAEEEVRKDAKSGDKRESSAAAASAESGKGETETSEKSKTSSGSEQGDDIQRAEEGSEDESGTSRMAAASPDTTAQGRDREEAAAKPAQPSDTPAPAADASQLTVFIEAVEIDGEKVFVAGTSQPGRTVRVYANEILLGDALVSPGGRFLVESRRELPVGDYIIRADLLDENGADVVARAAVPFERPEGEKIAAVAPQVKEAARASQPTSDQKSGAGSRDEAAAQDGAGGESRPVGDGSADAGSARSGLNTDPASDPDGKPDEGGSHETAIATQEEPNSAAAKSGEEMSESRANGGARPRAKTDRGAPTEGGSTQSSSGDEVAIGEPASNRGEGPEGAGEAQGAAKATGSSGEEASSQMASANDGQPQSATGGENGLTTGAPTVTAPRLEPVDNAVIIRRGDTLWQISRRVYGRGVRYTNIYLANQGQIRDPHWIWPGQVFAVPDTTREGVPADMSAIGDQAVPLPEREANTNAITAE